MVEIFKGVDLGLILPIILITVSQAQAILQRDRHRCLFPENHCCNGKLTVHHISDKQDIPENLITVCQRGAHWGMLHNGASHEDKMRWARELAVIAQENTARAIAGGWQFN